VPFANSYALDAAPAPFCGDGTCDAGEDSCSCSGDCGAPPSTEGVCTDGLDLDCDGLTDCDDSDCSLDAACAEPFCGDNTCDAGEDVCGAGSCEADCGAFPTTEQACDDGQDDDCDGLTDCDDSDCDLATACAAPVCNNNGTCEAGEDCNNCGGDCAGVVNGKPSNRYCCGDGVQDSGEGDGSICDGNY